MEKIIYLVNGTLSESYEQFKNRVFEALSFLVNSENPAALKLVLTEFAPPGISIIPFRKQKVASVSVFQEHKVPSDSICRMEGFSGVYSVTEALPVAYTKVWSDGEATPGVCLFTLFNQKKDISYTTFIDRWHNSHTPLSLKLHPLWNYSRNVVNEKLTANSAIWDGIVEEHFRTRADLLNPFKFFGNPLTILPNMLKVYADTKSFLDFKNLETYLATEYWIVSKNF